MEVTRRVQQAREKLERGVLVNENAVTNGVILPILQVLGWDVFDTQVVAPQYPAEGGRADLALCCWPNKPAVLIEVKQAGREKGAERQLFRYAFERGIPMVVLSNGQEWSIYLPGEPGHYEERRVCKLDFLEREAEDLATSLMRYLSYDGTKSGDALKNARTDYAGVSRTREIARQLPAAWRQLLERPDDLLVDLLTEKVEDICGYRPDPDAVAHFLATQLSTEPPPPPLPLPPPLPPPPPPVKPPKRVRYGYAVKGQSSEARNAIDVLIQVLEQLSSTDPDFLTRLASRPRHGRTRRYVAKQREDLYSGRPDLARDFSHQLKSGWWVGTNYSTKQIEQILRMAAEVAGLSYGSDLVVWLGKQDSEA